MAYGSLENGFAEQRGCIHCKNFAAHRDLAYPPSFRALLEQLGIDPDKECEAFEYGPVEGGRHLYGGWFYLVGEMITARASVTLKSATSLNSGLPPSAPKLLHFAVDPA